jgi:hypothetical protein
MNETADWSRYIDQYCERTSAAFWAEPLNAVTNLAFIAAAAWVARELLTFQRERGSSRPPWSLWLLVAFTVAIGIGSFLFHTFATRWAELSDTLPIQFFILWYVACFLHWRAGLRWRWAWLGIPVFYGFARTITPLATDVLPYGSAGYAPALLALLAFAAYLLARRDTTWRYYLAAAVVFTVSLTLRTIDRPLCSIWPTGTHFLWHVLNGVTLAIACIALWRGPDRPHAAAKS